MNYKPLPAGLFIKDSNIEGQGLFTNRDLTVSCNLGTSHYEIDKIVIRTPLGGFINHSNTPNCVKKETRISSLTTKWDVIVVENIAAGDELTLKYTMYNPKEELFGKKEIKELNESLKESRRARKERTAGPLDSFSEDLKNSIKKK